MKKITITVENLALTADLYDTPTAQKIWEALPLEGAAHVWGEEIYFDVLLSIDPEPDARQEVQVGQLGWWPAGPAFCIFFGPTPVSTDDQPRAYSPVNVFGQVTGDVEPLKQIAEGAAIRVRRAAT